jgi:hypothetical protein
MTEMLYSHYFVCIDCGCLFVILKHDKLESESLGTPDCMPVCPLCKTENIYMDDVIEDSLL